MVGVRMSEDLQHEIKVWAGKQGDDPAFATAVRRLVGLGLTVRTAQRPKRYNMKPRPDTKQRARELAGTAIDEMTDNKASRENQAHRKRRLLSGPAEFRSARRDRNRK